MSMYNMLHGINPQTGVLLKILDINLKFKCPDYLDSWSEDYESNEIGTEQFIKKCITDKTWIESINTDIITGEEL